MKQQLTDTRKAKSKTRSDKYKRIEIASSDDSSPYRSRHSKKHQYNKGDYSTTKSFSELAFDQQMQKTRLTTDPKSPEFKNGAISDKG